MRGSRKRLIPFTALPVGVCNGDCLPYLRKDIGHTLCLVSSLGVYVYIVHMCARRRHCVYLCVYSSKVLALEGQTAMISVIFVFCLFRRPRKI